MAHAYRCGLTVLAVMLLAASTGPTPTPKATHPPKPRVTLVQAVTYLLPLAKNDFSSIKAKLKSTNHYDYETYHVTRPAAYDACGGCVLTDNYADSKFAEAWTAGSTWYYNGKPTPEQLAGDGAARLSPLLKGFKMSHGTSDGRIWVDWDGPNHVWVELRTNDTDYDDPGYLVRVGHSLSKPVHVVKVTTFTDAQKAAVKSALESAIKLSLNDGPNNFTSLRGAVDKKFYKPNDFEPYACAASFPPLDDCQITGLLNYSAAKWLFEFRTPGIGGSTDDAKAWVHSVVADALPSSYSVATPSGPYPDDYEWTAPGSMEFSYKSDYGNGVTTFKFTVWHFLE